MAKSTSNETLKLMEILTHLGGPTVPAAEIEWASDLPAGRKLVRWLVDQLDEDDGEDAPDLVIKSSLQQIALENEEAKLLIKTKTSDPPGSGANDAPSGDYARPSQLKARTATVQAETELLETEVRVLKRRLQLMKTTAQDASKKVKSLKAMIGDIDGAIIKKREELSDSSMKAEADIGSSIDMASQVLQSRNTSPSKVSSSNDLDATLSALTSLRSQIIFDAQDSLNQLSQCECLLPSLRDIHSESNRLRGALLNKQYASPAGGRANLLQAALDLANMSELEDILDRLDDGGEQALQDILEEIQTSKFEDQEESDLDLDIRGELELALSLDEDMIARARKRILEKTTDDFQTCLIPLLIKLHETSSEIDTLNRESEALITALLEEIEEVTDSIRAAKEDAALRQKSDNGPDSASKADALLEDELTETLKRLDKLRKPDAPSSVFLDRDDTLRAIVSLMERLRTVEVDEEEWSNRLVKQLAAAMEQHSALLSTIYQNSPLNSSPPFEPPPEVASAGMLANEKSRELAKAISKLQKEIVLDGRKKKEIDSFVERWARRA